MAANRLSTALELAPVVERVHGAHHPELTRVRELTQELSRTAGPDAIADMFRELRSVTNDYTRCPVTAARPTPPRTTR